ncbi:MAG TPA: hypothetical protein VL088_14070 [Pedobacter sp.]|nr:hypothetical protein [Pedobacter sp.]
MKRVRNFFLKKAKLIFCIAILAAISKRSFAQENNFKIDTVNLKVYYIKYIEGFPLESKEPNDIHYKNYIVPINFLKVEDIPNLNAYKPSFNGLFIISDDDMMANGGALIVKNTYKKHADYIADLEKISLPDDFIKYKAIPNAVEGAFNKYVAYRLDAMWIKYTSTVNLPSKLSKFERDWYKDYDKKVPASDGMVYNYYVLHKINSYNDLK